MPVLILILSASYLSGCLGTVYTHNETYKINGLPVSPPMGIATATPSGILVYEIKAETNASLIFEYEYERRTDRLNPLQVVLLPENEPPIVPIRLRTEYNPDSRARNASVSVAGIRQDMPLLPSAEGHFTESGIDALETNATRAFLVVTWANLDKPARIRLHWMRDADVEAVIESASVTATTLEDFHSGTHITTPAQGVWIDDQVTVGSANTQTYIVVAVLRAIAQEGELRIKDADREELVPLSTIGDVQAHRTLLTMNGETALNLRLASASSAARVQIITAVLPNGTLPKLAYTQAD